MKSAAQGPSDLEMSLDRSWLGGSATSAASLLCLGVAELAGATPATTAVSSTAVVTASDVA